MTFIGGCIAVLDKNKDADSGIKLESTLGLQNDKYGCGDMMLTVPPLNLWTGEDCKYGKMDRGWFRRVHNYCYSNDKDARSYPDACKLNGFGVVLAYAITCGIGWIASAAVAFLAALMGQKLFAFAAAGAYAIFYIIFIGLFSAVWHSVRKFNKECLNKTCTDVKKRGKKSSYEFLAYSICSFVLILGAIVCCVVGALGLEEDYPNSGGAASNKEYPSPGGDVKQEEPPVVSNSDYSEYELAALQEPGTEERPEVTAPGQEFIKKFNELNKYIADKDGMHKYANKKFDETDADKLGTIVHSEFKVFVANIMREKGLPTPSDKKIAALMKKYDKDKNDTLEKGEFHNMLLEIFIESREILISEYASKRAESWKPGKVPTYKDLSRVGELDELLNNTDDFHKEFEENAKRADANQNGMLDIEEVTELVKEFCNKYKTPVLNKRDIIKVMHDMGRDIKEYNSTDLRMVAYALMSISRNLLK
jgi:Ca2+-binding EF-hand superfamily protein